MTGPSDDAPLDAPIEEDFRASALGLGWNAETRQLILEAHDSGADETDVPDIESDDEGPNTVRVRLSAQAARAFADRTLAVVSAGRPRAPSATFPWIRPGTSAHGPMATAADAGDWHVMGPLSEASNATFLVKIHGRRHVYKPV